jgi:hypothetical protein
LEKAALAYKVSRLLEIIGDGKWHETNQLKQLLDLSDCEVQEIAYFLGRYDFAQVDDAKNRVKINKDFKRILTQTT